MLCVFPCDIPHTGGKYAWLPNGKLLRACSRAHLITSPVCLQRRMWHSQLLFSAHSVRRWSAVWVALAAYLVSLLNFERLLSDIYGRFFEIHRLLNLYSSAYTRVTRSQHVHCRLRWSVFSTDGVVCQVINRRPLHVSSPVFISSDVHLVHNTIVPLLTIMEMAISALQLPRRGQICPSFGRSSNKSFSDSPEWAAEPAGGFARRRPPRYSFALAMSPLNYTLGRTARSLQSSFEWWLSYRRKGLGR